MTTAVQIASNALLMLGQHPISAFTENNEQGRIASNLWPTVRDFTLRQHPWNCAIKRVQLSPLVDAPVWEFSLAYQLPGDWLRTLKVSEGSQSGNEPLIRYRMDGRSILTDINPVFLRYIWRNIDPETYDAMLVGVLETAMAAKMAYGVTKSTAVAGSMLEQYLFLLKQAKAVDGLEDVPEDSPDSPLISVRGF